LLDAKVNLDYGISLFQQGRYHEAVEELGEAANSVRKLSADLKSERLAIDRLMQEAQYRWYLAQPK
jgi:Flp pilus assembly protein TadD